MVGVRSTGRSKPPGVRAPSGTLGIACRSGRPICGRHSCSSSRSVGSVPEMDTAPGQPMLTTSWITRATGCCSRIGKTCRVCATGVTAGRRWKACKNRNENLCGESRKKGGRLGAQARERTAEAHTRVSLGPSSPTPKKFCGSCVRPQASLGAKNFPHGEIFRAEGTESGRG